MILFIFTDEKGAESVTNKRFQKWHLYALPLVPKRLDGWWNQKWILVLEKELPCFPADVYSSVSVIHRIAPCYLDLIMSVGKGCEPFIIFLILIYALTFLYLLHHSMYKVNRKDEWKGGLHLILMYNLKYMQFKYHVVTCANYSAIVERK
jgi:hypothetical protein